MIGKLKGMLQVVMVLALALQVSGCFFVDRDHRRHYGPPEHHDHGSDAGVDIRVHG